MNRRSSLPSVSRQLAHDAGNATAQARNEAQLRHELENALQRSCLELGIAWTPFQLDRTLRGPARSLRFVDVAHGAVVIEYEAPASFRAREGERLGHAKAQAEEYVALLADEEGRSAQAYLAVVWDGAHIAFGRRAGLEFGWDRLLPFDDAAAQRVLDALAADGVPLVHPRLLSQLTGPESPHGAQLVPALFSALQQTPERATTSKTQLLFTEWQRLFGQAAGVQSEGLRRLLQRQSSAHGHDYAAHPQRYLFALHTYIAMVAKFVAACALPGVAQDIRDRGVPIAQRIGQLESGALFQDAGIANMLNGDYFSWYADDPAWPAFAAPVDALLARLSGIDFDVSRKSAASTRDLFKGIYESFVPRELRHALGEFYTPDWLAEHALNVVGWTPADDLLDPTCGSGTFLLEALRRRVAAGRPVDAAQLLHGLHGFDLNPLAVLSAKASLAVNVAPYLDPARPVRLPVYLADAINPAMVEPDGHFGHVLQTELGERSFRLPGELIRHADFFRLFERIRQLVDAGHTADDIALALLREAAVVGLDDSARTMLAATVGVLCELHAKGWNGIWCPIVADRFAAGAIGKVRFVCGNPPWVKWSHLPPQYARFIGPRCRRLGVFSSDRWVGGIESDVSTVITFEVIDNCLADDGKLAFFITGTVFSTESSEGFRQMRLHDGALQCAVIAVEDYTALAPFDGVSARPTLMVLRNGSATQFPVPYRVWSMPGGRRGERFKDADGFVAAASCVTLDAAPVPGGRGARPWLVGRSDEHAVFAKVFGTGAGRYVARKGVTTDRNGIFWVRAQGPIVDGMVRIGNEPQVGRARGIAARSGMVEARHLFPLLRGRGVEPFRATVDPDLHLLLPQRGMHGDPQLPVHSPGTFRFLRAFQAELEGRSSYKRFQRAAGHPFYSLWSTGEYTFAPFKVLWREMGGGSFAAAYVGSVDDALLGRCMVVPDHKVYFIPVESEDEAAYLSGVLNSPLVSGAVAAYAAQLSLGTSVAEYLRLPAYDAADDSQRRISELARTISARRSAAEASELAVLDQLAHRLFDAAG